MKKLMFVVIVCVMGFLGCFLEDDCVINFEFVGDVMEIKLSVGI